MNSSDIEVVTELVDSDTRQNFGTWVVCTIEGAIIFSTNLVLFLAIASHRALQKEKEYIFIAGLAFVDCVNGLAYVAAGIHRFVIIPMEAYNKLVGMWDCLMTLQNFIWIFGGPLQGAMLLAISIDRILSGVFVLRYLTWGRRYALGVVGVCYAYSLAFGLWAIAASYMAPYERIYPYACLLWMASPVVLQQYSASTAMVTGSVVGYFIVWLVYKYHFKNNAAMSSWQSDTQERAKRQRRMTISMGISNLFTLFLCSIPYATVAFLTAEMPESALKNQIVLNLFVVYNLNPIMNVIIYMARHKEIQLAIKALRSCKVMPPTLKLWTIEPALTNQGNSVPMRAFSARTL